MLLALKSGELAAEAIVEGLKSGDTSAAQLGKWGPAFNRGVDRMRRLVCEYYDGLSFAQFVRHNPGLQGTITDLLIGDLFTDRVDTVWQPMEALYPPGKRAIPPWNAGTPQAAAPERPTSSCCPKAASRETSQYVVSAFRRTVKGSGARRNLKKRLSPPGPATMSASIWTSRDGAFRRYSPRPVRNPV